jgi:hypothetical protein
MTTTHRRGAAAVIALIILSLTGLTATAYTRADLAASSADAAAVAGWRALYAAESGVACAIAWRTPAASPSVPPQISASLDPQIDRVGLSVVRVTGSSAQSHRHIDAQLRRLMVPRPLAQSWTVVATTTPMPGVSADDSAAMVPDDTGLSAGPGNGQAAGNGKAKDKNAQKDSPDDHDNGKGNDDKAEPDKNGNGNGQAKDKNAQKDSPDDHDNGKGNDGKAEPDKNGNGNGNGNSNGSGKEKGKTAA